MSQEIMEKQFPKSTLKSISELIDGDLDLTAANGTKIAYTGWTEIEVRLNSLEKDEPAIVVPFLITNDNIEYPILGYNVIEELIKPMDKSGKQSVHLTAAAHASFQDFSEEVLLKLVELIQATNSDKLCVVKSTKRDMVIPANRTVQVNCRANIGPVAEKTPVLFEPDELASWPDGLTVHETLTTVKQGSTSQVKIDIVNTTNHDIVLRNRTVLGRLQLVQSITPVEVKLKDEPIPTTQETATSAKPAQVTV